MRPILNCREQGRSQLVLILFPHRLFSSPPLYSTLSTKSHGFFQTTCGPPPLTWPRRGSRVPPQNRSQTNRATEIPNPLPAARAKWSDSPPPPPHSHQKQPADPCERLRTADKGARPEHRPKRMLDCDHARLLSGKGGYEQAHTAPAGVKA